MANKEKITIKLNNLKFDAQNPRLPMRLQGVTDENKVIDYMVKYGNVTELMLSIGETGYSEAEPLLVVKEGTDKYIVVEGNRRLAALKLLNDSELTKVRIQSINSVVSGAKYIPEEVPCIVYASREDVLDYLGYRHITGVKDWGALEKARYLDQLYQIHIKSTPQEKIYQKLAKMIGRDIVIKRKNIEWEIGLSIKHNHDAVKHSRLSHKLDFGNEWFGMPCSDEYWEAVEPVFDLLKQEKNYGTKWSEIADKSQKVYIPLLQAFIDEINRANEKDQTMPRKMIEYLIGIEDYYKVVSKDSKRLTMIHTFNMHDTLNKPAKNKVSAITVPIVKLPTRLVALEFKPGSDNTVEMYLDNGWQLSFRIHNASTKVEPSLKFDVQFVSMPMEVLNIECRWN